MSNPRKPIIYLIALMFAAAQFAAFAPTVNACSCAEIDSESQEATEKAWADYAAIFSGIIDSIDIDDSAPPDYKKQALITPMDLWKGGLEKNNKISVRTSEYGDTCGYGFEVGEWYIVYAEKNSETGYLTTSLCSPTKKAVTAGREFDYLNELALKDASPLINKQPLAPPAGTPNAVTKESEAQPEITINSVEREQLEYFKTHSSEVNRLLAEFSIRELDITCYPYSNSYGNYRVPLPGNCIDIKVEAKLGYTGALADYLIDFESFAQSIGYNKGIDFNDIDVDTVLRIIRDAETQAFVRDFTVQNQIQNAHVSFIESAPWRPSPFPFAIIYEVKYANEQNYLILRYGDKKLIEYSTDIPLSRNFQFPHREKLVTSDLFHDLKQQTDSFIVSCGNGPLKLNLCALQVVDSTSSDYCQIFTDLDKGERRQNYFMLFDHNKIVPKSAPFEVIEKIKDKTYLTKILDDSLVRSYIKKYPQGFLEIPERTYEKDALFLYPRSVLGVWTERGDDDSLKLELNCSDKPQTIKKVSSSNFIAWRDEIMPWILLILYTIFAPLATGWLFHRRFVLLWQWLATWVIFSIASFIIMFAYQGLTSNRIYSILVSIVFGLLYSISIIIFGFLSSIIGARIQSLRSTQEIINRLTRKERIALALILYGIAVVPALVVGKIFFLFKVWLLLPQVVILVGLQCIAAVIIVLITRHFFAVAKQREPKPLVFNEKDYIVYALILIVVIVIFLFTVFSYLWIGRGSFAQGTLVLTPDGFAPIESLSRGDQVVSFDDTTQTTSVSTVAENSFRFAHKYYLLNGAVKVTGEHPFALIGKDNPTLKWKKVKEVLSGDKIVTYDKTGKIITSIKKITYPMPLKVYNPKISFPHTYFVIMEGVPVLVHNKSISYLTL